MFCAGYVLLGGKSSRMGTDKALLSSDGMTMAQLVAGRLSAVADPITLVGNPERYTGLGYPVIPDLHPGDGPLAGIEAALQHSRSEWSFVLSCDMPGIPVAFLKTLTEVASQSNAWVVVPEPVPGGLEPLCALYRRACSNSVSEALATGRRRVKDLLEQLPLESVSQCERSWFRNLNTPEDWDRYQAALATK